MFSRGVIFVMCLVATLLDLARAWVPKICPQASMLKNSVRMTSAVPRQSDFDLDVQRSDSSAGDFDRWFWGNAHAKGGVEHAVFQIADSAVVLFDGECNFCNAGVWMMISNSDARNMRFCSQGVR
ncbi:unnamed protein product, partial [Discosporangium mesarthrocarpum]